MEARKEKGVGGFRFEEAAKKVETRKEFADTAFFKPHIVTTDKDGRARFTFISPEQLTSWRIKLFAFTKDVKEGTLTEEAVTRKDLMVRADLPFRVDAAGRMRALRASGSGDARQVLRSERCVFIVCQGGPLKPAFSTWKAAAQYVLRC